MEVHHHAHTSGKKWTHYFWEFFMLFLAVTLGFFVENKREHFIEHQRENTFARLLYDDLKKDTAWLKRVIDVKEWRGKKIDSMFYFMNLPDLQKNAAPIYYYCAFLFLDLSYSPNDVTIQQLRSSGTLRYFDALELYNAITLYYNDCNFYLERETKLKKAIPTELRAKIFNSKEYSSMRGAPPDIMDAISYPVGKMKLLTTGKPVINEFLSYAVDEKLSNNFSKSLLRDVIAPELKKLIVAIKDKYKLD
jgi:hypothetical protein